MTRKIDERIGQKFAIAAATLMTRVFSRPLEANPRRLMFACGPAMPSKALAAPGPQSNFDVLGLGFRPGREWKGPTEIFVEEMRDGQVRYWDNCRLWADSLFTPLYLLTADREVCFSYDGNALIRLLGEPDKVEEGAALAKEMLRAAARRVPDDIEQHRMM